jgi:hypothetical protein
MKAAGVAGWLLLALAAGCSRGDEVGIPLTAPFDRQRVVGSVTAEWKATDEERAFADGRRLEEPEVRVRYRVDVRNDLEDKVFVRLDAFTLVDTDGLTLGADRAEVACTLGTGAIEGVLAGDVWLPKRALERVQTFRVGHLAVPLSERGRSLYREWRMAGQSGAEAAVDAEITGYGAAPACTPR